MHITLICLFGPWTGWNLSTVLWRSAESGIGACTTTIIYFAMPVCHAPPPQHGVGRKWWKQCNDQNVLHKPCRLGQWSIGGERRGTSDILVWRLRIHRISSQVVLGHGHHWWHELHLDSEIPQCTSGAPSIPLICWLCGRRWGTFA